MHPSLITIVAYLTAAAVSASRILVATRPAWGKLPATFQVILPLAIPALAMLVQELAGVKTGVDLTTAIIGAVLMAVPGLPSNRSSAPLQAGKDPTLTPSAGDVAVAESMIAKASVAPPAARMFPSNLPPALALLLVVGLAFHTQGCALFGAGGSVWPKLGACAPTADTLFSEVESVLTSSGGNYEDDLLALGKTEGLSFVECAVKSVVEALSARIAARKPGERITPDEGIGVARGKAFLAKIGTDK